MKFIFDIYNKSVAKFFVDKIVENASVIESGFQIWNVSKAML